MNQTLSEPPRAALASRVLVAVLVGIFLFGLAGFVVAVVTQRQETAATARPSAVAASSVASADRVRLALAQPASTLLPEAAADASSAPSAEASPSPLPGEIDAAVTMSEQPMPIVPVGRFWANRTAISLDDITRALTNGQLKGFKRIIVADGLADALATSLGIEIHADVAVGDATAVRRAVSRGALGLVPATDVSAGMRALDIGKASLFGNGRVADIAKWPLVVDLLLPEDAGWDQGSTWVLVAGGDSFTDRGVFDSVVRKGRGVDYPFDGGTAKVTGHGCCDPVFRDNVVPRYVLTGNKGAVRKLFRDAELAVANHEQPVTPDADFHGSGLRFSGRPELTEIFTRAGIDYLSLANNHIRDYGADGIKDTRKILRRFGIGFGGAGKDLQQARKVTLLDAKGTKVAIIPCLGVVKVYWAGPKTAGATPCLDRYLVPDIRQAAREADVVIVYPHWGVEYNRKPLPSMRKHAEKWIRAGADVVLGGHSHVAGAIEDFEGGPVLYSLGNLIFDQNWSTNTMESMLVEATFHGGDLAQLDLRPYIIHNQSQPNFLDPHKGEGRRLLKEVRDASKDWLDW